MENENKRLLLEIMNRLILHAHPCEPGWDVAFRATFDRDEFESLKNMRDELQEELCRQS